MKTITKTLAASVLAISLTASGAHAGVQVETNPNTGGILIGAAILGLLTLLIVTGSDDDGGKTSTKNGPDLGVDLPPQGGQVIAEF